MAREIFLRFFLDLIWLLLFSSAFLKKLGLFTIQIPFVLDMPDLFILTLTGE